MPVFLEQQHLEGLFALEWIEGDWRGLNPLLYKFV
jgi:hypothetical protein